MQLHTKNDAIAYFWRCNCIKAPKVTIVILIKKELKRWGFTSVMKKQSKFFGITFFFVIFAA